MKLLPTASIPKFWGGFAIAILILRFSAVPPAYATCASPGILRIAGQIPDVVFTSGIASTTHVNPWWASFEGPGSSCGVFARSTVAGVAVQDTYGCSGDQCKIHPPGEWAAIKSAYFTPFDRVNRAGTDIPLIFDGKTPRRTHGTLEIGIIDNDFGDTSGNHIAIINAVNVYIESAAPPVTWFTILSAPANISGDHVIINHPYLNGKPGALLFVSHVRNPNGAASGRDWNHAIAVQYDSANRKWTIRNVDGTAMPAGLGFNVRIDPTAFRACTPFIPIPRLYDFVTIDNLLSNDNLNATILVTPIGGSAHPVAVRPFSPNWQIVYSDGAQMGPSTCFNVKVFAFTQYIDDPANGDLSGRLNVALDVGGGVDMGGSGLAHNVGSRRLLPFAWAQDIPNLPIIVTSNLYLMPLLHQGSDPKNIGVFYERGIVPNVWGVFHEDQSDMPANAKFNVWAPH